MCHSVSKASSQTDPKWSTSLCQSISKCDIRSTALIVTELADQHGKSFPMKLYSYKSVQKVQTIHTYNYTQLLSGFFSYLRLGWVGGNEGLELQASRQTDRHWWSDIVRRSVRLGRKERTNKGRKRMVMQVDRRWRSNTLRTSNIRTFCTKLFPFSQHFLQMPCIYRPSNALRGTKQQLVSWCFEPSQPQRITSAWTKQKSIKNI